MGHGRCPAGQTRAGRTRLHGPWGLVRRWQASALQTCTGHVDCSAREPTLLFLVRLDNQFRMSILERLEQMERRMAEMTGSQQHKPGSGGGGSGGGTGSGNGGSQAQVPVADSRLGLCAVCCLLVRRLSVPSLGPGSFLDEAEVRGVLPGTSASTSESLCPVKKPRRVASQRLPSLVSDSGLSPGCGDGALRWESRGQRVTQICWAQTSARPYFVFCSLPLP